MANASMRARRLSVIQLSDTGRRILREERRARIAEREARERIAAARAIANAVWFCLTVGLGGLVAWLLMR